MMDDPTEKCFYCDKPATRYCDFVIGGPIGSYKRVGKISDGTFHAFFAMQPFYTCDMPLCEDHKHGVGMWHASGKDAFSESIDHCHEHLGADQCKACPITEDESNMLRREIKAKARRRLIAEQNKVTTTRTTVERGK